MNYELAKQLKDAGFEQEGEEGYYLYSDLDEDRVSIHLMGETMIPEHLKDKEVYSPTLSELIEACGDKFCMLVNDLTLMRRRRDCLDSIPPKYRAESTVLKQKIYSGEPDYFVSEWGGTPEEAVSLLWLELNKK